MKLTKTIAAVAAVALTVSAMSLAALADEGEEPTNPPATHTHTYGNWSSTADGHSRTCTSDECDDSEGKTQTGSHDTNGNDNACSVCGYKASTTTPDNPNPPSGNEDGDDDDDNNGGDNGNTSTTTPGASSGSTMEEVNEKIDKIAAEWDYSWVPVSGLESWAAAETVKNVKEQLESAFSLSADLSLVSYTVGENGKVTFTVTVTVGGEEVTRDIVITCNDDRVTDDDDNNDDDNNDDGKTDDTVISEPSYTPPASSSSSAEVAAAQVVESPRDVAASRRPDIIVNASESGVSTDIVAAFVNNRNAQTLTIACNSTLKVAIAKEDISDAAAELDFSVSGENFLSSNQVANLGATAVVQLDFVNTGKLEGVDKATIRSSVGMGYVGKTVTVYEMVNGKLVKVGVAKVNGAGIVKFDTDHLGQFVLAVK